MAVLNENASWTYSVFCGVHPHSAHRAPSTCAARECPHRLHRFMSSRLATAVPKPAKR